MRDVGRGVEACRKREGFYLRRLNHRLHHRGLHDDEIHLRRDRVGEDRPGVGRGKANGRRDDRLVGDGEAQAVLGRLVVARVVLSDHRIGVARSAA
jgi:hypothetical protein